jgi:hypothetical protein
MDDADDVLEMGALEELGLKPGVIYGDDVLHVLSVCPIALTTLALRIRSQASIRHPCHRNHLFILKF